MRLNWCECLLQEARLNENENHMFDDPNLSADQSGARRNVQAAARDQSGVTQYKSEKMSAAGRQRHFERALRSEATHFRACTPM
jgi:hypothetical protein